VEWVDIAQFAGEPRVEPRRVEGAFDSDWRKRYGGLSGYGYGAKKAGFPSGAESTLRLF
jgi:hypothetical protein